MPRPALGITQLVQIKLFWRWLQSYCSQRHVGTSELHEAIHPRVTWSYVKVPIHSCSANNRLYCYMCVQVQEYYMIYRVQFPTGSIFIGACFMSESAKIPKTPNKRHYYNLFCGFSDFKIFRITPYR